MFSNIKNSQKGISLVLTFFIMAIILAIVFGVSAILFSEIKIIRGMGNSVVAFYAADSGIEKTFYYDRKKIPAGGERGLCDICSECGTDCSGCNTSGDDCSPSCTDCKISYYTEFNGKKYEIEAIVVPLNGFFENTIKSFGSYKETTRAVELTFITREVPDYKVTEDGDNGSGGSPNGYYFDAGTYNSQPYYERQDEAFAIWYDSGFWTISTEPGVTSPSYWTVGSEDPIEGTYDPAPGYTGNPVVAAYDVN